MKPSIRKIYNIFKIEVENGYGNKAVIGGLNRITGWWEGEARADGMPEDLIQFVISRITSYPRLSPASRAETLQGLWRRIQREYDINEPLPIGQFENTPIPAPTPPPESPLLGPKTQEALPVDSTDHINQEQQVPLNRSDEQERTLVTGVSEDQEEETSEDTIHEVITDRPNVEEGSSEPFTDVSSASETGKPSSQTSPVSVVKDLEPAALKAPVTVLSGVGPATARNLARLELRTLRDLLFYFPRRYDDYSLLKPINRLNYGEEVTVIGTIHSVTMRKLMVRGNDAQIVEAVLGDGTGLLRLNWFNQPWVVRRLHSGAHIVLSGKVDQYLGRAVMNNPEWEPIEQQQLSTNRIVPVYPLTAQITQRWLRRTMHTVVTNLAPRLQDPLPEAVRQSAGLMDLTTAILQVHFPETWEMLKNAQQRISFDEILLLQLGVLRQKRVWQERSARIFMVADEWLDQQLARLPFPLTGAQQRSYSDIRQDLQSGTPMNRLLQGDVGSGKTVVAALSISSIVSRGAQAALMAPTSILAEQHYQSLLMLLAGTAGTANSEDQEFVLKEQEIALLIGATPEAEKQSIREGLTNGSIRLVIGTHALLEDPVQFADLQLVIVDEQHRFGVEQRASLRAKGDNPHLLVMTATPIPRSLALTVYGDLDLSIIDEMPPGRQPVSTYVLLPRERERAYRLIRTQVQEGRQAFIIYPLVEESEKSEARAAVEEHQRLQKEYFPELQLGLLHGRLRPEEKDQVMTRFRDGEYNILVSTSVVEVGVDVPNSTVMVIEGANRFGLAQLHQFRGRVGRGAERSFCILIPDSEDKAENERLQVMTETNDGFVLAEKDLEQRGPGLFLGTRTIRLL